MSDTTMPGELDFIERSIQSAFSQIERNSTKRCSQEQQLISTVVGAKCLNSFFSEHPPSNDEVVRALRSAGAEEQLEIECIQRYEKFISVKSNSFGLLVLKMSAIIKELSRVLFTNKTAEGCISGGFHDAAGENQSDSDLVNLLRLWRTVLNIYDLVHGPLIEGLLARPPKEFDITRAEEERSFAREVVLRNAITDTQKMLVAAKKRWRDLTTEAEAVHMLAECKASMRYQDRVPSPIRGKNDECFGPHITEALSALQQSTERMRKERAAVDESTATLAEKIRSLDLETVACKCSTEATLQTTREVTDSEKRATNTKEDALRELHERISECTLEEKLLETAMENHKKLSVLLLQQTEDEKSNAERVAAAEQTYYSLLAKGKYQQEKLTSLRFSIECLESEINHTLADKQRIADEVHYLLRLFSNPTVAKRVLIGATERCSTKPTTTAVQEYLRFIHKVHMDRLSASSRK